MMLIDGQKVNVKITKRNIGYYKSYGYKDISLNDMLSVDVKSLTPGSHYKVDVKCDYCGKIVKVQYKDYLKYKYDKYSCCECKQMKQSEYTLAKRRSSLYGRAYKTCEKMGYKLLTQPEDIFTSETKVLYECPKHGIHETKIYTLITGHGCIECGIEASHETSRKTPDEVYNDFKNNCGILLNKEDYKNWNHKNLKVICASCGDVFVTSYNSFMQHNGQLCSKCANNISKHEYIIKRYLESHNIRFSMQHRFYDCRDKIPLPFDFYLYDYNIAIEYDGEGHYISIRRGKISEQDAEVILKNIKKRDDIKTKYCNDNGITLIRIPYWDRNNIENILNNKLYSHKDIV